MAVGRRARSTSGPARTCRSRAPRCWSSCTVRRSACSPSTSDLPRDTNYVRFQLNPQVQIALGRTGRRRPARASSASTIELAPHRRPDRRDDAYERLLGDAMDGENLLFAREDGVEARVAGASTTCSTDHDTGDPVQRAHLGPEAGRGARSRATTAGTTRSCDADRGRRGLARRRSRRHQHACRRGGRRTARSSTVTTRRPRTTRTTIAPFVDLLARVRTKYDVEHAVVAVPGRVDHEAGHAAARARTSRPHGASSSQPRCARARRSGST